MKIQLNSNIKFRRQIFYFLLILYSIGSCVPAPKNKAKPITKRIDFKDSLGKLLYYEVNHYSSTNLTKDSVYSFYPNNELLEKSFYSHDSLVKDCQYVDGKLKYMHDYKNNIVYEFTSEGNVLLINNNKDSTNTIFYKNSKKVKTFMKFNHFEAYYHNTYDSVKQSLLRCFRHSYEDFKVEGDKLHVRPYFESKTEDISKYTFTIILLDKDGFVKNTYFQKGLNPHFILPYEPKMKWIKVVCDSIGCYSLPFTYTN